MQNGFREPHSPVTIKFQCPNCDRRTSTDSTEIGGAAPCPVCGAEMLIPTGAGGQPPPLPETSTNRTNPPPLPPPVRVAVMPVTIDEIAAWRLHIDVWALILAVLPWFFTPLLGAAGLNAAVFRIRAKAKGQAIPAWPLVTLGSLWILWLVLSGWAVWLVRATLAVGLFFLLRKFRRDNEELWKSFDYAVLQHAVKRTLSLSWLIVLLLIPGIAVGWATHTLIEFSVGKVEKIPQADIDQYFPEPSPPPRWPPGKYLAYKFDPWRLLVGKVRDGLVVRRGLNEAPKRISNAARCAHHILQFAWWLFIAYACYVAVRLYLYVFARSFVGRGGKVVLQLERSR
jgi:hypothetical protein